MPDASESQKPTVTLSGTVGKIIPANPVTLERELRFQLRAPSTFTESFASKKTLCKTKMTIKWVVSRTLKLKRLAESG
jgi:hypothetical protein